MSTADQFKQFVDRYSLSAVLRNGPEAKMFAEIVMANARKITSVESHYLDGIGEAVRNSVIGGITFADLILYLQNHVGLERGRAWLLAHDQTRRAFTGLSKARAIKLGIKKYEWLYHGAYPLDNECDGHVSLSKKIFSFDDPPVISKTGQRGHPGDVEGCRCRFRIVLPSWAEG